MHSRPVFTSLPLLALAALMSAASPVLAQPRPCGMNAKDWCPASPSDSCGRHRNVAGGPRLACETDRRRRAHASQHARLLVARPGHVLGAVLDAHAARRASATSAADRDVRNAAQAARFEDGEAGGYRHEAPVGISNADPRAIREVGPHRARQQHAAERHHERHVDRTLDVPFRVELA